MKGIAEFNPTNLPNTKKGICQNDDHESWTGDEPVEEELQLMMFYSDEYNNKWCELDKSKLTDDEFDKLYDKYELVKWQPNTEQYWCEACIESLQ